MNEGDAIRITRDGAYNGYPYKKNEIWQFSSYTSSLNARATRDTRIVVLFPSEYEEVKLQCITPKYLHNSILPQPLMQTISKIEKYFPIITELNFNNNK